MSEERNQYLERLDLYNEQADKINTLVQKYVAAAAEFGQGWQNVHTVTAPPVPFPGLRHSITVKQVPSLEELAELMSPMHQMHADLRLAYNRVPESQRAGVVPPPKFG